MISLEKYKGKKVLVTGHTGFKGSWLSLWLYLLGAKVIGIALDPVSEDDNFFLTKIGNLAKDFRFDIREKEKLFKTFKKEKPDIVFHLAAQPLVLKSYQDPLETFEINTLGTANILEAIRLTESVKTAIIITTDKVYENQDQTKPYSEEDRLGGYDPYSASKGAAELIIASYIRSFFNPNQYKQHGKSIVSVRAGNVIGGGDWAINRIVPDCIRALAKNEIISVRSPKSVRPWQHVLEPLSGYLLLGALMQNNPTRFVGAWNFGPEPENIVPVEKLVRMIIDKYGRGDWVDVSDPFALHESRILTLNINKAKRELGWKPVLDLEQTVDFTINWYKNYKQANVRQLCINQIEEYSSLWKLKKE